MQVYLVRHSDAHSYQEDRQRGLSDLGLRRAKKMARHLASLPLEPFLVYHSDELRARQTAEIIVAAFASSIPIQQRDDLGPNASIRDWLIEINSSDENMMLVGHLPFMAEITAALLTDDPGNLGIIFETATVVRLCRKDESCWLLEWMLSPEIVP